MSESMCLYDRSLAQQLCPQFHERSLEGPHVNTGFHKERNNNPHNDVFHMGSMTLGDFLFCLPSDLLEAGKEEERGETKIQG